MNKCRTCCRDLDTPYRRHNASGKIIEGCIAEDHNKAVLVGESLAWHNRPEAKEYRAAAKARLKALLA